MRSAKHLIWAVTAAAVVLSGCSESPEVESAKYLEKGRQALQQQKFDIAILHLKNAVKARPMDAEPYYQLGLAHLASGDINTAGACFRRASELNPKHANAQLKLAALMSTSRSLEMVEEARKRTLDVLAALPGDVDALNVLAAAELRLGKPEDAEAHLEQALKKAPKDLKSSVALARTRMARKDVAGAGKALEQAVAQAPDTPEARVYLGGFYVSQQKPAEAEQQFRKALDLNPKYGPALLALAELQAHTGRPEEAGQTYRRISALPEKRYRSAHALFLLQSGKRDQAVAELETLAATDPADRAARTELVKAYLEMNRTADAERVLTAALKTSRHDTDALLQRSRVYLASRKLAEAQNDLNRVLHYRKNSAEAHYLLSKVSEARQDRTLRKHQLGEALRLDPSYLAARTELAQLLLAERGAQAALGLLDQAPEDQRRVAPVVLMRNWALMALGRGEEARQEVQKVLEVRRIPEALVQHAVLEMGRKNYTAARESVEQALRANPSDVRALSVLVQTYAAQNQMPAAVPQVRKYAAEHPSSAAVQLFLGRLLFSTGDRPGARKAFDAAKAGSPAVAELALAELDIAEQKNDAARARLATLLASQPGNLAGRLLMARLDMMEGKTAAAIGHYRKAVESDDKNAIALNDLAYLLSDSGQPDEALKYAQKAKELAPENAAIDDTLGWTYYRKGLYGMAVTHLESATAREGTARRRYHLAMAYVKAGDAKRGRQAYEAALKMDPNLPEAQQTRRLLP